MNTDPDRSPDIIRGAAPVVRSPALNSSTKAWIGVALAGTVGLIIFLFVQLSHDGRIHPGPALAQAECTKGQRDCLPEINYVDTTGVAYSHASLAGKVVLVNFWATWCHPCEKEIPDLSKVYEKYKSKGVVFLGMLIDNPDSQQLLNFQSDHEMTYPVVRASRELMASYNNPDAYPTTFVYDRGGKQVYSHLGALRERELDSLLGTLVAQK
jgi:thiol-disulfide isomerase/thioredoxin